MERPAKIRLAAEVLLAKYGKAAPRIARIRALTAAGKQDHSGTSAWKAIARSARTMVSRSRTADATLSDVLGGAVTEKVMAADQVKREDVERLMVETNRRREDVEGSE